MTTDYEGDLVGQVEEGIEKAEWISSDRLSEVLGNSYENIKLLFE